MMLVPIPAASAKRKEPLMLRHPLAKPSDLSTRSNVRLMEEMACKSGS